MGYLIEDEVDYIIHIHRKHTTSLHELDAANLSKRVLIGVCSFFDKKISDIEKVTKMFKNDDCRFTIRLFPWDFRESNIRNWKLSLSSDEKRQLRENMHLIDIIREMVYEYIQHRIQFNGLRFEDDKINNSICLSLNRAFTLDNFGLNSLIFCDRCNTFDHYVRGYRRNDELEKQFFKSSLNCSICNDVINAGMVKHIYIENRRRI